MSLNTSLVLLILIPCCVKILGIEILYLGCFKKFNQPVKKYTSVNSALMCSEMCRGKTSPLIAVKDKSHCYCGNITEAKVLLSNCNIPCLSGHVHPCGGKDFYSVYASIPSYNGCFESKFNSTNIIENECYVICSRKNYIFNGMKNNSCKCLHNKTEENLPRECQKTCGENKKNAKGDCSDTIIANVYSRKFVVGIQKHYNEVFHCQTDKVASDGTCHSGTCEDGWRGIGCEERDCSINNGDCGNVTCVDYPFHNITLSECSCLGKFVDSNTLFDKCIDFDECLDKHICPVNTTCVNTMGSYTCNCLSGFRKEGKKCKDIDECLSKKACSSEHLECLNLEGSYICHCETGYFMAKTTNQECREDSKTCSDKIYVCDKNMFCKHISYPAKCYKTEAVVADYSKEGRRNIPFLIALCVFLFVLSLTVTVIIAKIYNKKRKQQRDEMEASENERKFQSSHKESS